MFCGLSGDNVTVKIHMSYKKLSADVGTSHCLATFYLSLEARHARLSPNHVTRVHTSVY